MTFAKGLQRSVSLNQLVTEAEFDQAYNTRCSCFSIYIFSVGFYSADADVELIGNFTIAQFFVNQIEHLLLLSGKCEHRLEWFGTANYSRRSFWQIPKTGYFLPVASPV